MHPGASALLGLGEGQTGAAKSRVLGGIEQVDNAQREERVTRVAVRLDRGLVHGEHQHGVRIPGPHGEWIGIEEKPIAAFAVGEGGVAALDRFGHLVEGRRE